MISINIEKTLPDFHLSVQVETANRRLGFLGSSGSGKSLTLKCLSGLIKPDLGNIHINNTALYDSQKDINIPIQDRKIGYLFQDFGLIPHMTIEENLLFPILHKKEGYENRSLFKRLINYKQRKDAAKKNVHQMCREIKITHLINRYPKDLSGGEKQRVAFGRALLIKPEILILDEPFSALDTHLQYLLEKNLKELLDKYNKTFIIVTHNIDEAYRLCDHISIFNHGKIIGSGPKDVIFNTPPNSQCAKLTGCKNIYECHIENDLIYVDDIGIKLPIVSQTDHLEATVVNEIELFFCIRAHYIKVYDTNASLQGKLKDSITLSATCVDRIDSTFRTFLYVKPLDNENCLPIRIDLPKESCSKDWKVGSKLIVYFPKEHIIITKGPEKK